MGAVSRLGFIFCVFFVHLDFINTSPEEWRRIGQDELKRALNVRPNVNVAKNVILFLGDGMGLPTVFAARVFKGQLNQKSGEETKFEYETWPHVALSKTYNVDRQVADSAGTATAYLTGVKTNFGTVGVNENAKRGNCNTQAGTEVDSIVAWSLAEGKSVGIITTTRMTHATPAAAYAHSVERNWESDAKLPDDVKGKCEDIALQLVKNNNNIQVLMGGGRQNFYPEPAPGNGTTMTTGNRKDGRNLVEEWVTDKKTRGVTHHFVTNKTEFDAVDAAKTDYLFGLFGYSHMKYEADRVKTNDEPSLTEMMEKAIKILSRNPKGYWLLVEAGRIDHGHHAGLAQYALHDTIALETAVVKARQVTSQDDTLLVVTADHSHVMTVGGYPSRGNDILGLVDTDTEPAKDGMEYTSIQYANGPGGLNNEIRRDPKNDSFHDLNYKHQALVQTVDETHGGEDVAIYAVGPMAHLFHGVHEENYIAHVMAYASCVGENKEHCENPDRSNLCTSSSPKFAFSHVTSLICILLGFLRIGI